MEIVAFSGTISVTNDAILSTIRRCYDEKGYVVCPHTATALHFHYSNPTK